jgi:hypothetical protein
MYPPEGLDPRIAKIHKNIQNEPLIKKIEKLENQLYLTHPNEQANYTPEEKKMLQQLLKDFKELLKSPYGALGYLISTTTEEIIHLYGVDTDRDFYFNLQETKVRVPNPRLDEMVAAGGGKRWFGERGLVIVDPAETAANEKTADEAVEEIIASIKKKLNENAV